MNGLICLIFNRHVGEESYQFVYSLTSAMPNASLSHGSYNLYCRRLESITPGGRVTAPLLMFRLPSPYLCSSASKSSQISKQANVKISSLIWSCGILDTHLTFWLLSVQEFKLTGVKLSKWMAVEIFSFFLFFLVPQGKPTSLKTAQPSWVNLPRPLPKSRALKNSALRRTGSTSPITSTHSDLSTYSTNCKSILCQNFGGCRNHGYKKNLILYK